MGNDAARAWLKDNKQLFPDPTADEALVVRQIYAVAHFQQNIDRKKLYKGGYNADPFIIAKATVEQRTVVTTENLLPNAARIPNICQHLGTDCMNLEEFMEAQNWAF